MNTSRAVSGQTKHGTVNRATGLIIVNSGNGKGKTTAGLGLLLRAWGHDMKVIMLQFVKSSTANYGEHRAARRIGIEILAGGAGFTRRGKNVDKNKHLAVELWNTAKKNIESGCYDMVVLDEISYPLRYGWLPVDDVIDVLRRRPEKVHVVITGRDVPQELIDFADIVTEFREVKHHLRKGIKAQPGIEF